MGKTRIGWTEFTVNFYTWNCDKVSAGCKNCYAEALAKRYGKTFRGTPQWRENAIKEVARLPRNAEAFVNSMSDTFHEGVSEDTIAMVFYAMAARPDVTWLVLTKRIERAAQILSNQHLRHTNIWLGTSVENQSTAWRIDYLRDVNVRRFISFEPLLGAVEADLRGIDSVIVGAESGANRRAYDVAWARGIREQCARDGVPFYYKQGSHFKSGMNRVLDGRTWDALGWRSPEPEVLL